MQLPSTPADVFPEQKYAYSSLSNVGQSLPFGNPFRTQSICYDIISVAQTKFSHCVNQLNQSLVLLAEHCCASMQGEPTAIAAPAYPLYTVLAQSEGDRFESQYPAVGTM